MTDLYEHIAATIKSLRSREGWSQEQLANRIDEPANTISRWETGTYRPSAEHLETLAKLFEESITIFFPGMEREAGIPQALLSATRGLKSDELNAVIQYAEFTKARSILKKASQKHKRGRNAREQD